MSRLHDLKEGRYLCRAASNISFCVALSGAGAALRALCARGRKVEFKLSLFDWLLYIVGILILLLASLGSFYSMNDGDD